MSHLILIPTQLPPAPKPLPNTRPTAGIATLWHFAWNRFVAWRLNCKLRADLARLDAHLLRDIGLDRSRR